MSGKQRPRHSPYSLKNHKHEPDLVRVRGKIRQDEYFPEGGQCTTWITDGSSASDWDKDSHKENNNLSINDYPLSPARHTKPQFRKHSSAFHPHQLPVVASSSSKPPTSLSFVAPAAPDQMINVEKGLHSTHTSPQKLS